jgi:hypothetical protein
MGLDTSILLFHLRAWLGTVPIFPRDSRGLTREGLHATNPLGWGWKRTPLELIFIGGRPPCVVANVAARALASWAVGTSLVHRNIL